MYLPECWDECWLCSLSDGSRAWRWSSLLAVLCSRRQGSWLVLQKDREDRSHPRQPLRWWWSDLDNSDVVLERLRADWFSVSRTATWIETYLIDSFARMNKPSSWNSDDWFFRSLRSADWNSVTARLVVIFSAVDVWNHRRRRDKGLSHAGKVEQLLHCHRGPKSIGGDTYGST